ncbi:MAG TPA: hypothetical protein VHP36_01985 [Chitinispirillaceae bacterium]|nr:hypothetical protein [Chitinispirillaceae bacterium]
MHKRWLQTELLFFLSSVLLTFAFSGCSISGSVIDRARYETSLTGIRLDHPSTLDVYYGGVHRSIPLKDISMVEIYSSHSTVINNELCYGAEITLKNGTRIQTNEKDPTDNTHLFISVHNSIVARNGCDLFRIGLDNVTRINIK